MQDAQTTAIPGYPFLHANRFLVGLKPHLDQEEQIVSWLNLSAQLALQTHSIEINNLSPKASNELTALSPDQWQHVPPALVLQRCSRTLLDNVRASPETQRKILHNANVPDDYHTWKRIVGLYPLMSFPVAVGIQRWHTKSRAVLRTPAAELAVAGTLLRYNVNTQSAYKSFAEVKAALDVARQNALDLPLPDDDTMARLFATFAPVLEVDTVQSDDNIGAPQWLSHTQYAVINTARPNVYTLTSHMVFNGTILLQLNYVVWFPSRPCTSSLDSLCGHMDGITWRVTLGADGKPLVYDSMHNCGCYHTFFPTRSLIAIPPPPITVESRTNLDERAFSPVHAPSLNPSQQLVVRIAHRTHYIESIYVDEPTNNTRIPMVTMERKPYDTLRSLPVDSLQRNRSLFTENAIVAGTQRKERWFFWPLGVPSAGAMRQWGNHATAFIGRRHFDDPNLLDNAFIPANP
ncbi:MAG: hypothetical protein LJE85_05805 [Gammaproteobacteria bacterium]|nr:hypothetical protein [Gammaproteobacteria bacterium]